MENKEINDPKLPDENIVIGAKLENAKKEGLTKGVLRTALTGFVVLTASLLLVYYFHKKDHNNQLAVIENQKISFTEQLIARDSTINEWLLTFNEIEKNLNMIKEKENLITFQSSGTEFTKDRRIQILEDIKYINTLLEDNKKKIAQLNSQLKKSGSTITGLQTRIASLEESMKQYEADIASLKSTLVSKDFEIGQLNERVIALNDTIFRKDETIYDQTYRLNQAFIASGTFRDLKGKGLLSKEGGFLGIGRKESLIEDFADTLFNEIDMTATTMIPVNSRNAKLVTEHPSNSYELVKENENQVAYIEIKDPEEFWKISRYAVVELIK